MDKVTLVFVAACLSVGLLGIFAPRTPVENKYELAQKQTVVVDVPNGWGSGVVLQRGTEIFVLTADHVLTSVPVRVFKPIRGDDTFKRGNVSARAWPVFRDKQTDVALLWVTSAPLPESIGATISPTTPLPVGTEIFHVGTPHGVFDNLVFPGVVSQVGVSNIPIPTWPWKLTDAMTCTLIPGCSGGPIFSESTGELVGIGVGRTGDGAFFFLPNRVIIESLNTTDFSFAANNKNHCPLSKLELWHHVSATNWE